MNPPEDELDRWKRRARRERETRLEAERIAERATRKLYLSNARLALANETIAANSETLYRELFVYNPLALLVVDLDSGAIIETNEEAQRLYEYGEAEFTELTLSDIYCDSVTGLKKCRRRDRILCAHRTRTGMRLSIDLSVHELPHQTQNAVLLVAQDVTRQRQDQQTLQLRTQAIEASAQGVFICAWDEGQWRATYTNASTRRLMADHAGGDSEQVVRHALETLLDNRLQAMGQAYLVPNQTVQFDMQTFQNSAVRWLEIRVTCVNGLEEAGDYGIGLVLDVTSRKMLEAELRYRSQHDGLTGLANRALLDETMSIEIARAASANESIGVLFIDSDRFKEVNDIGGHSVGDDYLRSLAQRLSRCIGSKDTLARFGGDEFVVVVRAADIQERTARLLRDIKQAFRLPVRIHNRTVRCSLSIGVALFPDDGGDVDTLLRRADIAMYHVKRAGGGDAVRFASTMETSFYQRAEVERRLREAIAEKAFVIHYQPQIDIVTGEIVGMEALLRWPDAPAAHAGPARFIPAAEEAGLIHQIGLLMMDMAFADLAALRAKGFVDLMLAINISAVQFDDAELVARVNESLASNGLSGDSIDLEITESAIMSNAEQSESIVRALRKLGVALSIDDFGTGYSSLAYLHRLSVDRLKIDRSFVAEMEKSAKAATVARAIIDVGKRLDLSLVAEGIETNEQRQRLIEYGCRMGQGYYFSRPVPLAELEQLLAQGVLRPWITNDVQDLAIR